MNLVVTQRWQDFKCHEFQNSASWESGPTPEQAIRNMLRTHGYSHLTINSKELNIAYDNMEEKIDMKSKSVRANRFRSESRPEHTLFGNC